ncbi:biotin-dependent carboxyltransferase [Paenibacillus sp. IB182496]|uniref:Biotin-dependent carboxyltransferase n=1 Tax=Paenibacillus sabuli TaxID=2772509 RepID=A0A927GQF9_9BACL|nr:biotin-dependent carboxyltransferase family protein [Paenibacillus sabuli]MBD2843722.1 biotin-dependent carboxyltransferase [Paenibacillus sabuli]
MSLKIHKPGLLTTVQDLGRHGAQKYGVIVSGAMDGFALRTANLLVGNEEHAAGLEVTMVGPEIELEDPTLLSVCGGDLRPRLDGEPVPLWRTIYAGRGSRLAFGGMTGAGCRAYVAFAGGIDVPERMQSRSTYLRAAIGGYEGRPLRAQDRVPLGRLSLRNANLLLAIEAQRSSVSGWTVAAELRPQYGGETTVRFLPGEEYGLFDEASRARLEREPFQVLPQSDRMGYRLTGPGLNLVRKTEMVSAAVTFGTMQVPPDGNPIVLMADRQTSGGYPKLAQVLSADLPLLAQANLGERVRFRRVSLAEAEQAIIKRERALRTLRGGLEQRAERHWKS